MNNNKYKYVKNEEKNTQQITQVPVINTANRIVRNQPTQISQASKYKLIKTVNPTTTIHHHHHNHHPVNIHFTSSVLTSSSISNNRAPIKAATINDKFKVVNSVPWNATTSNLYKIDKTKTSVNRYQPTQPTFDINTLLGRSVKNVSKNKFKFIKENESTRFNMNYFHVNRTRSFACPIKARYCSISNYKLIRNASVRQPNLFKTRHIPLSGRQSLFFKSKNPFKLLNASAYKFESFKKIINIKGVEFEASKKGNKLRRLNSKLEIKNDPYYKAALAIKSKYKQNNTQKAKSNPTQINVA